MATSITQTHPFKEILEASKRLTTHAISPDLPPIERSLDQIEAQSRKLVSRFSKPGEAVDPRAHYLLADAGLNAEQAAESLRIIDIATTFDSLQPINDTDIEGYLRHDHEQIVIGTIEEGRRETLADFDNGFERSLHLDWEKAKKKIFEQLGQHDSAMDYDEASRGVVRFDGFTNMTAAPAYGFRDLGSMPAGVPGAHMNARIARYAQTVRTLNEKRLSGKEFGLVSAFGDVAKTIGTDGKHQQLVVTWALVASVVNERDVIDGEFQRELLREGHYRKPYLEPRSENEAVDLRKLFIKGAKRFLEIQMMNFVETKLKQNPADAHLGGVPSINNKIRSYITLIFKKHGLWRYQHSEAGDSYPMWAHIYHLFRIGHEREALKYVEDNDSHFAKDRSFHNGLKAYVDSEDRKLPKTLRDQLAIDLNTKVRQHGDKADPFRVAMYKIVGRCELSKRTVPEVVNSTEDYMWFQLALIRESSNDDEGRQETYTLADLQKAIVDWGPGHFNPQGKNPLHYLNVLLLSIQFERAVDYLSQFEQFRFDAVHLAIALAYYGLLRIPSSPSMSKANLALVKTVDGREHVAFNFGQLIHQHSRYLVRPDVELSLHYIFLLCLYRGLQGEVGEEQVRQCYSYIQEMVFDSGEFQRLVGDIQDDENHQPGFLQKHMRLISINSEREFVDKIVKPVAERAAMDGRQSDAVFLYNFAREYDSVVSLLTKQLSEAIALPSVRQTPAFGTDTSATPTTDSVRSRADSIMSLYEQRPHIWSSISPKAINTYSILRHLLEFIQKYHEGKWEDAITIMEQLKLIPLDGDMAIITRKAEEFREMDEVISRNLSETLVQTMTCLSKIYNALKESPYGDHGRQTKMALARKKARALMIFSGMIQFRMPADTYAKLNRLDVFMN